MNKLQIVEQEIAGKSNPLKPVESTTVNFDAQTTECAKLQNIIQGETGLSALCPWYSKKQLRRIDRIHVRKYKYGHRNMKRSSPTKAVALSGYIRVGMANRMEVIL